MASSTIKIQDQIKKEEKQENTEETEKYYQKCYYVPISFVLFLVVLTFPQQPTQDMITIYNMWIALTFQILPFDIPFEKFLDQLRFDVEHNPMKTREQMFEFVIKMHEFILGEKLNKYSLLRFFHCLRANECRHAISNEDNDHEKAQKRHPESGCKRQFQKIENVCLLIIKKPEMIDCNKASFTTSSLISHSSVGGSCFIMNSDAIQSLLVTNNSETANRTSYEDYQTMLSSTEAFCSSLFSTKWFMLHLIASRFPKNNPSDTQRHKYHTWLILFGKVLACFACKINFQSNIELVHYDPKRDLSDRQSFITLIYNLHNVVNNMLHKVKEKNIDLSTLQDFFHTLEKQTSKEHKCSVFVTPKTELIKSRFYFFN